MKNIIRANARPKFEYRRINLISLLQMIDNCEIIFQNKKQEMWNIYRREAFLIELKNGYPIKKQFILKKENDKLIVVEGANELNALYNCFTAPTEDSAEHLLEYGLCYDLENDTIEVMDTFEVEKTKIPLFKCISTRDIFLKERELLNANLYSTKEIETLIDNYSIVGTLFIDLPINMIILF